MNRSKGSSKIYTNNRLVAALITILPDHIKRMFFISGLLLNARKEQNREKVVTELNALVGLATKNEKALTGVGLAAQSYIWHDTGPIDDEIMALHSHVRSKQTLEQCAKKIISTMPPWLVYNDFDSMVEDVCDAFDKEHTLALS